MNKILRAVFIFLLNKRYIGGKHTPEDKVVKSKTKWADKKDLIGFDKEYKKAINEQFILKIKKRTGKGSGWHISLNPRKLKELYKLVEERLK